MLWKFSTEGNLSNGYIKFGSLQMGLDPSIRYIYGFLEKSED